MQPPDNKPPEKNEKPIFAAEAADLNQAKVSDMLPGNLVPNIQNVRYIGTITNTPNSYMQPRGQALDPASFSRAIDKLASDPERIKENVKADPALNRTPEVAAFDKKLEQRGQQAQQRNQERGPEQKTTLER